MLILRAFPLLIIVITYWFAVVGWKGLIPFCVVDYVAHNLLFINNIYTVDETNYVDGIKEEDV